MSELTEEQKTMADNARWWKRDLIDIDCERWGVPKPDWAEIDKHDDGDKFSD